MDTSYNWYHIDTYSIDEKGIQNTPNISVIFYYTAIWHYSQSYELVIFISRMATNEKENHFFPYVHIFFYHPYFIWKISL